MVGFKAITFKGKKTATKAFHTLEEFSPEYFWIDDVAVVSCSKHGHLRVNSTWGQDNQAGTGLGWGVVAGGLVGALAGPGGAVVGATFGGYVGAVTGAGLQIAFDDPALDDFAASLQRDTSALILIGEEETLGDFLSAVEPFGGEVIETNLDDKDVKALRKALER